MAVKKEGVVADDNSVGRKLRKVVFAVSQAFCAFSFIRLLRKKLISCALLALLTMLLLCIPMLVERYMNCHICLPVYLFLMVYAMGSLLGDGYDLYHLTKWWDKFMHLSSGVLFAMFGAFLMHRMSNGIQQPILLKALFAVLFSVAIAAIWEIFEYAADMIFHADMQNDTLIHEINSYLIGPKMGQIGHIEQINSVQINGQMMQGYIDIGLIDTMRDMIIETLGAVVYAVVFALDRDKHPIFQPLSMESKTA
ncbi:MAG: DUF2238 domain-containing protein [Ruminococcaceae bacterium]|nr:DUF2238 domain-containing protein [Oscillospiraceae bacterium]